MTFFNFMCMLANTGQKGNVGNDGAILLPFLESSPEALCVRTDSVTQYEYRNYSVFKALAVFFSKLF
jgi:hypothetical protein